MEELSDLEHIRTRPGMYIGDVHERGLHHVLYELLDNSIDQFLTGRVAKIRVSFQGDSLELSDDGEGLPFEVPGVESEPLATSWLTRIRTMTQTADGHSPHVHLGGWGCGLRIVTALTATCVVESWRNGQLWRQSFTSGAADASASVVGEGQGRGTSVRMTVDREIFPSATWSSAIIHERLALASRLFPGLFIETPRIVYQSQRGLAEWAEEIALDRGEDNGAAVWVNEMFEDFHVQATAAGRTNREPVWHSFANGNATCEGGTHLSALKQALSNCGLQPSVAMVHVTMQKCQYAGPTKDMLDVPELMSPMCEAIRSEFRKSPSEYCAGSGEAGCPGSRLG